MLCWKNIVNICQMLMHNYISNTSSCSRCKYRRKHSNLSCNKHSSYSNSRNNKLCSNKPLRSQLSNRLLLHKLQPWQHSRMRSNKRCRPCKLNRPVPQPPQTNNSNNNKLLVILKSNYSSLQGTMVMVVR